MITRHTVRPCPFHGKEVKCFTHPVEKEECYTYSSLQSLALLWWSDSSCVWFTQGSQTWFSSETIVSFFSSPSYELSKYLSKLLSPLVSNSESFVRNSAEFAAFIRFQTISPDESLVPFDVVSLLTLSAHARGLL